MTLLFLYVVVNGDSDKDGIQDFILEDMENNKGQRKFHKQYQTKKYFKTCDIKCGLPQLFLNKELIKTWLTTKHF